MSAFIILVLFGMAVALFSSYMKSKKEARQAVIQKEKDEEQARRIAKYVAAALAKPVSPEIIDLGEPSEN